MRIGTSKGSRRLVGTLMSRTQPQALFMALYCETSVTVEPALKHCSESVWDGRDGDEQKTRLDGLWKATPTLLS